MNTEEIENVITEYMDNILNDCLAGTPSITTCMPDGFFGDYASSIFIRG